MHFSAYVPQASRSRCYQDFMYILLPPPRHLASSPSPWCLVNGVTLHLFPNVGLFLTPHRFLAKLLTSLTGPMASFHPFLQVPLRLMLAFCLIRVVLSPEERGSLFLLAWPCLLSLPVRLSHGPSWWRLYRELPQSCPFTPDARPAWNAFLHVQELIPILCVQVSAQALPLDLGRTM